MKRSFDRIGVASDGGKTRPGYSVVCRDCGIIDSIIAANNTGSLPPEATRIKFSQKGWTISDRAVRDLCPQCSRKKLMLNKTPNIVNIAKAPMLADKPREMTREDKRLIFGKIDGVYIDEARGFENGWSDKRVSDDLGVPLAWVRAVREQNFGPEGLSAESRDALDAARKCIAELGIIESKINEATKELRDLKSRFARTERNVEDMHKLTVHA